MDKYAQKYIKFFRTAQSDAELSMLINKIYSDGFEDGVNEGNG